MGLVMAELKLHGCMARKVSGNMTKEADPEGAEGGQKEGSRAKSWGVLDPCPEDGSHQHHGCKVQKQRIPEA